MDVKKRKRAGRGKVAPKYFFIFDDVSEKLKTKIIRRFIKQHRHYKTKVIISTQVPTDLDKGLRKNMDQWLLFAGHDNSRLDLMKEAMSLRMTNEDFYDLYEKATNIPYGFLNVFPTKKRYLSGFDTKLEVTT